ncbi:hypothetical protein Goarm_021981, partial [Gossypium armourianum]|nr:hypothetical protein [Gossypium armourianum]
TYDSYFSYYYPESNTKNDEYTEDSSFVKWVRMLEDNISSFQATISSISNTLEQLLETVQHRVEMSTSVKEVKHEVLELKEKVHLTIVEHDMLNMGVKQEFGVGDHEKRKCYLNPY